jgi:hypothetical protein
VPSVNYDDAIRRRAEEVAANNARPDDDPSRTASRLEEHTESQRERFEAWQALGNHYADVMANPKTSTAVYNALMVDMEDLSYRAGLNITSPEVLRLLYPMLRDHAGKRRGDIR